MQVTTDHRPQDPIEMKRITSNGGKIYKTPTDLPIDVPFRVFPGRLSVSRTIGYIDAKLVSRDGNPKVVIAEPDIYEIVITNEHDFLYLGCDGIFENLSNSDLMELVWYCNDNSKTPHEQAAAVVDNALKLSMVKESLDNVTSVVILFSGLNGTIDNEQPKRELMLRKMPSFDLSVINNKLMCGSMQHRLLRPVKFPTIKANKLIFSPLKFIPQSPQIE